MAIAISTVSPSLTPSQQAAREFWRQAGADGMPPFFVMSQYYVQLSANSDNLPAVTATLDELLTGLGYATDVDTVLAEFAAGQGEELGYWAGRYCLFDSGGNRFDLVVGRNGATLTVPSALVDVTALPAGTDMASVTVLSGAGFSDGVLQLANAQFQASLRFALPISDASFDTPAPAAAMFQSTAPLCKGTFAVLGGGYAGLRPVNGKRGAWTQAGVNQAADGDPAATWYGQYVLLDVTHVTAVTQQPEPVYIYNDPKFGLTFQWGNVYGGNVTYINNVLQCADEDDDTTEYAMQFAAPQAGAAEINLAVSKAGAEGSYKGYWVGRYPPPSPASQARLTKRPMTAVYGAGWDASAGGYSQAIDVSSLTPGGAQPIQLPYGAVGTSYALSLNLTGCAATDTFSWTLTPGNGGNDATGRATITLSGGTNQTVQLSLANLSNRDVGQHLQVSVQLARTSAAPPVTYTLQFDIAVLQCDAISLEPPVLPPVVVGTAYTQQLVAHGANHSFNWSDPDKDPNTSLPPGLKWDANSQQLSGTVTDATQIGKAFSLVLGVTASDVIMNPLTEPFGITVQSAQAVASNLPIWAIRLIVVGSALVLGAIANIVLRRLLRGKGNAKTNEAVREGDRNIVKTAGKDTRGVFQNIAIKQLESKVPLYVQVHSLEETLFEVKDEQRAISNRLDHNTVILVDLNNYAHAHAGDEPGDLVEDPGLSGQGYTTFEKVTRGIVDCMKQVKLDQAYLPKITDFVDSTRNQLQSKQNELDNFNRSQRNTEAFLSSEE
jgi:hypothetical protein